MCLLYIWSLATCTSWLSLPVLAVQVGLLAGVSPKELGNRYVITIGYLLFPDQSLAVVLEWIDALIKALCYKQYNLHYLIKIKEIY